MKGAAFHEAQLAHPRDERLEQLGGPGALEREQGLLFHMVEHHLAGQALLELGDVAVLGRAVDDDVEIVAAARGHQVVDDPAVIVEQQRIFELHVAERAKVAGEQGLERRVDVAPVEEELAHVADVEQPGILAGPIVLGDDPFVLDRHLVSGERDHPRAPGPVPIVERQLPERRRFGTGAALRVAAVGRSARLGVVGRAAVDFLAHSPLQIR